MMAKIHPSYVPGPIVYSVYYTLYTIHCILYTVYYTLHTIQGVFTGQMKNLRLYLSVLQSLNDKIQFSNYFFSSF